MLLANGMMFHAQFQEGIFVKQIKVIIETVES